MLQLPDLDALPTEKSQSIAVIRVAYSLRSHRSASLVILCPSFRSASFLKASKFPARTSSHCYGLFYLDAPKEILFAPMRLRLKWSLSIVLAVCLQHGRILAKLLVIVNSDASNFCQSSSFFDSLAIRQCIAPLLTMQRAKLLTFSTSIASISPMTLSDYLKNTTQSAFAKQVGVSQGMVYQWVTGLRPVSPDKCISIERATNGAVTCEELLPDFDWQYLRSPKPKEAVRLQSVIVGKVDERRNEIFNDPHQVAYESLSTAGIDYLGAEDLDSFDVNDILGRR